MNSKNTSNPLYLSVPHGLLLVNKPRGWRSFDVVRYFQRITQMRKIGHSGTLDEQATGLIVLAFGRDTSFLSTLLACKKTYVFRMVFGAISDTLDGAGHRWSFDSLYSGQITAEKIKQCIQKKFLGEVAQVPPIYSCLKQKGKRLHEYARNQEEVEIEPRKIMIHQFQLISFVYQGYYPQAILEVECSSGTYIRSIARDLGMHLGTHAYLADLCRTSIGPYHFSKAVSPKVITSMDQIKALRISPYKGE